MLVLLELQNVSISLAIQNPPDTRSNHHLNAAFEYGGRHPFTIKGAFNFGMNVIMSCLIFSGLVSFHWRCWFWCVSPCDGLTLQLGLCTLQTSFNQWSLIDIHHEVVCTCLGCGVMLGKVPPALLASHMTWRIDMTVSDSSDFKPSCHWLFQIQWLCLKQVWLKSLPKEPRWILQKRMMMVAMMVARARRARAVVFLHRPFVSWLLW